MFWREDGWVGGFVVAGFFEVVGVGALRVGGCEGGGVGGCGGGCGGEFDGFVGFEEVAEGGGEVVD